MTTVRQLLEKKGREVLTVQPDDSVFDAIEKMAKEDVGSVIVMEDGKLVGIFTERHYARNVFLKGKSSPATLVGNVMERNVVCVRPEETVEECMAVMTEKRVRHLPVMDQGKLLGILSIGDLVKSRIADQEFTIEQLVDYVHG